MKRLYKKTVLILYSIIWVCQMPVSLLLQKLEKGIVVGEATEESTEKPKKSAKKSKKSTENANVPIEDADSIEIPVFDEKPMEEDTLLPATASNSNDELADSLLEPMNQLAIEDIEETDEDIDTAFQLESDALDVSEEATEAEEDTDTIVQPDQNISDVSEEATEIEGDADIIIQPGNTSSNDDEMIDVIGQDNNDALESEGFLLSKNDNPEVDFENFVEEDDWNEKKYDDDDDDIASLFTKLEEEVFDPRKELIASLPNTTGEDLLEEAVGVTTIIRRWQQY